MPNPFSGIITTDLKDLYNNMIDAVIEENSLSRPCKLVYDTNNDTTCPNCIIDNYNGRSTNIYNGTGVIAFSGEQICPYCNGEGTIYNESYDTIFMGVLWRYKDFQLFGQSLKTQDGDIQTITHATNMPQIKNTKYMTVELPISSGTDVLNYRYERNGEPQPAGFGDDRYLFVNWKRTS